MNQMYLYKLKRVVDEYVATKEALNYIIVNRDSIKVFPFAGGLPLSDFKLALSNIEITFFMRLFAEFEGCLRDFLQTRTSITVDARWGAEELINRVTAHNKDQSKPIDSKLVDKVKMLKKIRNDVVHATGSTRLPVTIEEARSVLNTYLSKL